MPTSWFCLVGTSHVARDAKKAITTACTAFAPTTIAVELDPGRLEQLLRPVRQRPSLALARRIGPKGFLFALFGGWLQRKLGARVNLTPGADMLAAVTLARQQGLRLLLIDQELVVTLRRLNRALGWREARQFLADAWRALLKRERITFDLSKVPGDELVARLISELREKYPRPYQVLVEERNRHMARALRRFRQRFPDERVLVVVGIGHKEGLARLLAQDEPPPRAGEKTTAATPARRTRSTPIARTGHAAR